jgi:ComEC/Rec2-related protein
MPVVWTLATTAGVSIFVLAHPRTWNCWFLAALGFFTLHTLHHHYSDAQRLGEEFATGGRVVRATGLVWSEPEKTAFWSRTITAHFRLKLESIELPGGIQRPDAIVNVNWSGPLPTYGDRITCTAQARNLEGARNPGEVDFTRYLARQGIRSELTAKYPEDCRIVDHGHGGWSQVFAMQARRWIRERLEIDLKDSPETIALIESMVLGLRGETPGEVKEMFQRTGTLHLFAVSGLNVAMLAAIAWFIFKPLGVGRRLAVLLIIPILAGYALVTGLSASCVRATIMGSLLLLAFLFDRPAVVYNSLAAAALGILAWDTNQLFVPGFQFSFVLVFTIVWLAARIQRRVERFGQPDAFLPRALWSWRQRVQVASLAMVAAALGVTLSAWIGSLFFTAGYFHLFSLAGIGANLLAVPIAFAILALGVGALLVAPVWTTGTVWLNNANWLCAKVLVTIVRLFAEVPGGHVYVELPPLERHPECEFAVLDVGEGAGIHLRSAGRDWLLDCGHASQYGRVMLPYLRSRGVNRLDGLLLTHGDAQHIGAAPEVFADFAPRLIIDSTLKDRSPVRRAFHAELAENQFGKRFARRGDHFAVSPKTTISVLFPPPALRRTSADDKALVLRVECAGRRVLFMSDSGFATEQWLVENETDLRADVLVKGQHAKDLSGTLDFIARVQPEAVVCSALGYGAEPRALDEWARSVAEKGIAVFRQDDCGAVQGEVRDGQMALRGFTNAQTFRTRR